jgi:hypothetical protein
VVLEGRAIVVFIKVVGRSDTEGRVLLCLAVLWHYDNASYHNDGAYCHVRT